MTFSIPTIAFWLGSMAVVVILARYKIPVRSIEERKRKDISVFWWYFPLFRPLLVAVTLLLAGLLPWGYQTYQDRADRHEYTRLVGSMQEELKRQEIEDAVLTGNLGRGEWWAIPYESASKGKGVMMTTGKDAEGKDVWFKIQ